MECTVTSTERYRRRAFTLVEYIVAIGVGGILLAALMQVIFFTGRSFAALMNYTELDRYSRNALDQMVYKIREADELKSYSSNRLVFSYWKTNELVYEYLPNDRALTETLNGRTKTLLKGCDVLTFSIYQRNTAAGTFNQFPATITNSSAKLVQMSWTCSRNVLGARINTESVQSAKIVLRNQ
ncbi:MAG TPA: prepilin-type N-terminal cleavage/methylation domain-containing protein [Verrucomicrobiae bacterium]|nr:prepilin-type N-terminal cleavage/methylation domain-containing protein [Verrucomicrobiae bacterium]